MAKYPQFRVGAAFPESPSSVHLLQALLCVRQGLSYMRPLVHRDHLEESVQTEQFFFLFLASVAAAKEAADAFREADRHAAFSEPQFQDAPSLSEALAFVRDHADAENDESLYKRIILDYRHNAGAHWSAKLIARALRDLQLEEMDVAQGGETTFDSSIPLARVLAVKLLEYRGLTLESMPTEFQDVSTFQQQLRFVVETAVSLKIAASLAAA